jgi:hypothetical protein
MKLKSVFFISLTYWLFSFHASAQSAAIQAGLNIANVTISEDGRIDDANSMASFQAGITGRFPITPILLFQTGMVFTGKGSKTQSGNPSGATYYKATSNPFYLEVPANFIFRTPTGPLKFFAGAGPYLAIGIAGKNKSEGKYLGVSFRNEKNIEFSNDDPSTLNYEEGAGFGIMKRFDYGLNGLIGIEGKQTILALNYGYGLAKLQSGDNSSADDKNKHRVVSFILAIKLK